MSVIQPTQTYENFVNVFLDPSADAAPQLLFYMDNPLVLANVSNHYLQGINILCSEILNEFAIIHFEGNIDGLHDFFQLDPDLPAMEKIKSILESIKPDHAAFSINVMMQRIFPFGEQKKSIISF